MWYARKRLLDWAHAYVSFISRMSRAVVPVSQNSIGRQNVNEGCLDLIKNTKFWFYIIGSKMSLQVWSSGRLEIIWSESVILPVMSGAIRVLKRVYTSRSKHFISAIARLEIISASWEKCKNRLTVGLCNLFLPSQTRKRICSSPESSQGPATFPGRTYRHPCRHFRWDGGRSMLGS